MRADKRMDLVAGASLRNQNISSSRKKKSRHNDFSTWTRFISILIKYTALSSKWREWKRQRKYMKSAFALYWDYLIRLKGRGLLKVLRRSNVMQNYGVQLCSLFPFPIKWYTLRSQWGSEVGTIRLLEWCSTILLTNVIPIGLLK